MGNSLSANLCVLSHYWSRTAALPSVSSTSTMQFTCSKAWTGRRTTTYRSPAACYSILSSPARSQLASISRGRPHRTAGKLVARACRACVATTAFIGWGGGSQRPASIQAGKRSTSSMLWWSHVTYSAGHVVFVKQRCNNFVACLPLSRRQVNVGKPQSDSRDGLLSQSETLCYARTWTLVSTCRRSKQRYFNSRYNTHTQP